MRKHYWLLVLWLVLAPTLACSLPGSNQGGEAAGQANLTAATPATTTEPTGSQGSDSAPKETPLKPAKEETTPEEAAQPGGSGGSVASGKFSAVTGLGNLSAYRVNFIMDFDGQSGDKPVKGHIDMALEATQNPPARHMTMSMTGSTVEKMGGVNGMELYVMEGKVYLKNAAMSKNWILFSGKDAAAFEQGFFAPDKQLTLPDTADCATQPEMVNGVSATKCSFSGKDVTGGQASAEKFEGEVWVATDGKYIVKYTLKATGYRPVNQGGQGLFDSGTVSFDYNVKDINGDFAVTLPAEAKNAAGITLPGSKNDGGGKGQADTGDIPMLDDAEEVTSVAGFTSYFTATAIKNAVDFYRQKLVAAGWKENTQQTYTDDNNAILSFAKGGKTLMLTITKQDKRTNVIVTIQ